MSASEESRVKKLSPTMRTAYKVLKCATKELLSGGCTEEEVAETMSRLSPQSNGYKREEDYVTIDKGMQMLGMNQNRVGFCELMKRNGIVNEKFNSVHIGYNRQKILSLKHKQEEEYQIRLAKIEQKKKKEKNI